MRIDEEMTSDAVLVELGRRVAAWRLDRGLTQEQLAFRADIGRATLQRLEAGASVQLTSLVKLLRSLGMLGALDALVPKSVPPTTAELDGAGDQQRPRQRAPRQHRARAAGDGSWQWLDGGWQWADENTGSE
jgi:transcriptional regulator with XRE-family HTH domain